MASIERTVSVIFQGKDDISRTARLVGKNIDDLSAKAGNIAGPFAKLADGVLAADAALLALAGGGLAYAFDKSVKYENALLGLTKVLDENTESLDDAKAAALAFSDKYGESFDDIIGQFTQFKQAGYSLSQSIGLVEDSLQLMIAGDVEAAQASEILTRTLKGLGAEAEFAGEIVQTLNWVSNNFATDVPMLGEALARSAPLARQFGLTMQETAGLLTPMIEVFQDAEMASTAFRSAMARIKDDTGEVRDAFEKLGFSQEYIANRAMMSTKDILLDVSERFGALDTNMQGVVSSALFGKEHFAKMSVVLNEMGKVAKIAGMDTAEAAAALDKELETRLASAEQSIKRFINNLGTLSASVGDQFRASAAGAIGGLADLEAAIRTGIDAGAFDPLFGALENALDTLGDFVREVAKAVPDAMEEIDFSDLLHELGALGDEINQFFDGVDLTTVDGLASAFQFAVDGITALVRITAGMVAQFEPVFQAIGEGIRQINELDRESAKAFGGILGAAKLVQEAGGLIAGAFFVIGQSGAELENIFNAVIGSTRFLWNSLQLAFDGAAELVTQAVEIILGRVRLLTELPGIPDSWRQSVDNALSSVQDFRKAIEMDEAAQLNDLLAAGSQAWDGFTGSTREAEQETRRAKTAIKEAKQEIGGITPAQFRAVMDDNSLTVVEGKIEKTFPPERDQQLNVQPRVDAEAVKREAEILERTLDRTAEIIQSKIEWTAKLDIAEVEANAQKVKALAESIGEALAESTKLLGSLFGDLGELSDSSNDTQLKWRIFEQIEKENLLREKQLQIMADMAEAEIRMMEAQRRRFESEDALITFNVDGSRLHDSLEYVLYEMLKWTQIKAGEEDVTALLGLTR